MRHSDKFYDPFGWTGLRYRSRNRRGSRPTTRWSRPWACIRLPPAATSAYASTTGERIFIGHGRSAVWRELKDFLVDRLSLPWEEFNREVVAGITTTKRLEDMLANTTFAFLVMTAEDEHADGTLHARENVVQEVGLFQGRLGPHRAIVLLEEGCRAFSNIHGLSYIPFPPGRISAAFEEIRRVLERENIVKSDQRDA